MNSIPKTGADQLTGNRRRGSDPAAPRDERREGLVLLVIALLFVANVILYLCHHYGLTSLNDFRPGPELGAHVRVLTD